MINLHYAPRCHGRCEREKREIDDEARIRHRLQVVQTKEGNRYDPESVGGRRRAAVQKTGRDGEMGSHLSMGGSARVNADYTVSGIDGKPLFQLANSLRRSCLTLPSTVGRRKARRQR